MKSVYVIYALLGVTIGTLVLADVQTPKPVVSTLPPSSAAESSKNITESGRINESTTAEPSTTINTTTNETTTLSTTTVITTVITKATTNVTTPTTTPTTTTPPTTTPIPTNTTIITSTTVPTPTTPAPKPPKPPTSPAPAPPAPTDAAKTTTAIPPSSKDRQFDGLSFFGGIILTTCLMAIAAFSWRFYRQCKEGNYRTL